MQWLLRTRKVKMAQTATKYRGLMEELVLQVLGVMCMFVYGSIM